MLPKKIKNNFLDQLERENLILRKINKKQNFLYVIQEINLQMLKQNKIKQTIIIAIINII